MMMSVLSWYKQAETVKKLGENRDKHYLIINKIAVKG